MTLQLDGIPASVSFAAVKDMLIGLGLELRDIPSNTENAGVHIGNGCITVDLYARNADGEHYLDGKNIAMHRVSIPIVRDESVSEAA